MTLQNRVLPTGQIVAIPIQGTFMGNRGILHRGDGTLGPARWRHPHWICCVLSFKDRHRPVMTPGHYTELFFHDEAVALAAGHRPCAECRRRDHLLFLEAWRLAHGERPKAAEIDRRLHATRVEPQTRCQRWHRSPSRRSPTGPSSATTGPRRSSTATACIPLAPSATALPCRAPRAARPRSSRPPLSSRSSGPATHPGCTRP
ncbi:hypothetical protein [Rubellimicrobium mesophilum]|uniref:hypothetical protein n=1 Tax=Rubellimicrobium mesophilum TaxID=1123067 RepID=UPI001FDEEE9E|nr:hypothetical protein [Rubellimicrobium mesophilum]